MRIMNLWNCRYFATLRFLAILRRKTTPGMAYLEGQGRIARNDENTIETLAPKEVLW